MDEQTKKAFDAAQDVIKQLLTLSTAIIGAVVTFSGNGASAILDFKAAGAPVPLSMALMLASIMSGFCALLNIIGALSRDATPSPYKPSIRIFAGTQIVLFFISMLVLGVFAPHWNWSTLRFW